MLVADHKYRQAGRESKRSHSLLMRASISHSRRSAEWRRFPRRSLPPGRPQPARQDRFAEVTSREPGRKCSSMCGTLRAQKVTDFTRRVLISPSLPRWSHSDGEPCRSRGRVAIRSKLQRHRAQHRQRAAFLQLSRVNLHDFCFRRVVEKFPTGQDLHVS